MCDHPMCRQVQCSSCPYCQQSFCPLHLLGSELFLHHGHRCSYWEHLTQIYEAYVGKEVTSS